MKILVTGKGGSGSWACRGEQLGNAMGATVKPMAGREDVQSHDVTVVVKRTPKPILEAVRESKWALDVVDFYPQPECAAWAKSEAVKWVQCKIAELSPAGVIWPNHRMRQDCDTGLPGVVVAHHYRPGIITNPVRPSVRKVGYEGREQYLAEWLPALEKECGRRNWQFVCNPVSVADLDIVVAMRGGQWGGYAPFHWKSNVKLANAHGSGTPFVGQPECGYRETASDCEYWAEHPSDLRMCFDWLADQSAREAIHARFIQAAIPVEQCAADLKAFLRDL